MSWPCRAVMFSFVLIIIDLFFTYWEWTLCFLYTTHAPWQRYILTAICTMTLLHRCFNLTGQPLCLCSFQCTCCSRWQCRFFSWNLRLERHTARDTINQVAKCCRSQSRWNCRLNSNTPFYVKGNQSQNYLQVDSSIHVPNVTCCF